MCRYAFNNYKQTWSCFKCRKSFKKINLSDYLQQRGEWEIYSKLAYSRNRSDKLVAEEKYQTTADKIEQEYYDNISKRPECGQRMANMGMDFKSPKTTDIKSWKIIEGMHRIGAIYQTCGCEGFGFVPQSKTEYIQYLEDTLTEFLERLKEVEADKEFNAFERSERAVYWAGLAKQIREVLRNQ